MRPCPAAVVFRGERDAQLNPRLVPIAQALAAAGLQVAPVPYSVGDESALRHRIFGMDEALVWADPLGDDGDRTALDDALRSAEATGVWVSARPDVIDRIGHQGPLPMVSADECRSGLLPRKSRNMCHLM